MSVSKSKNLERKLDIYEKEAKNELKKSTYFDHLVINDSLDETISEVKRILASL